MDLDGTDAHIEGNVFLNIHTDDPSRESTANAIATDNSAHLTIVRNLFVDVDHVLLLKNDADALFENNTVVGATIGAINFDEPERSGFVPGDAVILRGNIFENVATIFVNQFATEPDEDDPVIIADNNIMPAAHHGLGAGNIDAAPLLTADYALASGSPAIATGINGADMGFDVPPGASISGEPAALTRSNAATLAVHMPGISGIEGGGSFATQYRWRLDGGPWSSVTAIASPIPLTGLNAGAHSVDVVAKDSAGVWQSFDQPTTSLTWTVDPALSRLLITEVLASNGGVFDHEGTMPDYIEIWNDSPTARDVGGMVLSDSGIRPGGWSFPASTTIPPANVCWSLPRSKMPPPVYTVALVWTTMVRASTSSTPRPTAEA